MSDFSDLLQQAEKLTNDLATTTELPRVERSLKQVLEASNELYSRVAQTGAKDIQANLLLGSKGIDLPKIAQKLESISTKRTFEPIEPIHELDITGLLENEMRNKVLGAFDKGLNDMLKSTYDNSWKHQEAEWKQQKRKIFNSLMGRSGLPIEVAKHRTVVVEKQPLIVPYLGPTETIYASKIVEYNNGIVKGLPKPNLVQVFSGIAGEFKDSKVKDMWEIIKYVTTIPAYPHSDDAIGARYSKSVIEVMVNQAKKYLEDRYKLFMNNFVTENLIQAGRGGVPGTYPLVRSFVGLRLKGEYLGLRDGRIEDRPIWPMVYYCLRSGDLPSAIYCIKKSCLVEYNDVILLLEAKLDNPDGPNVLKFEEVIKHKYKNNVRNETDPFKRIVWAVLGCCDIADEHSEVATTADDYLWLKLSLVRTDYGKMEHINFSDLQQVILEEYGESHYDAFHQPHLYFQVLTLTGQFEAALEFLSRIERYRVHAVHMAIALNELYMLAGPHDTGCPMIFIDPADPKPARRLNLARLIMLYVRTFEINCPNEALHYFYHLRNYNDSDGRNLFKVSVADLSMETKEYERIFGKVQINGIRTNGLIDQFTDGNISVDKIAQMVADILVNKGLCEEALDLYDIANNQEEILKFLCAMLSQVIALENKPGSLRNRLQSKTFYFAERFSNDGYRCSAGLVSTFIKLKELLTFFDLYHSKEYPQALKVLNELQLVPFRLDEIADRTRSFKALNSEVCKVIPDILLATMNMLFDQYQKIKGNTEYIPRYQDNSVEKQLTYLRDQAKTITNFAGMLSYRMPGDTNSRLVQMEILMH